MLTAWRASCLSRQVATWRNRIGHPVNDWQSLALVKLRSLGRIDTLNCYFDDSLVFGLEQTAVTAAISIRSVSEPASGVSYAGVDTKHQLSIGSGWRRGPL